MRKVYLLLSALLLFVALATAQPDCASDGGIYTYYSFDNADLNATQVYDLCTTTGYEYNGTRSNGPVSGYAGAFGESMFFDGTNDFLNMGTTWNNEAATTFTYAFWYKPNATFSAANTTDADVFQHGGGIICRLESDDGQLSCRHQNLTNVAPELKSTATSWTAGSWYHIVYQQTNTTWRELWINGTLNATDNSGVYKRTNNAPLAGTTASQYDGGGKYWHGQIDEFVTWLNNSGLTSTEISNLYQYNNLTGPVAPANIGCTVALNTPADATTQYTDTPTVTATATCYQSMATRCYLTINGTQYGDNTTMTNTTTFQIVTNTSLENAQNWDWNITCTNTTVTNTSATRSFNTASCRTINTANHVENLWTDLNTTGTCFEVTADNVTIDCHGNEIWFARTATGNGIYANNVEPVHVTNCYITHNTTQTPVKGIYHYHNAQTGSNSWINNTRINMIPSGADAKGIISYRSNAIHLYNVSINITSTTTADGFYSTTANGHTANDTTITSTEYGWHEVSTTGTNGYNLTITAGTQAVRLQTTIQNLDFFNSTLTAPTDIYIDSNLPGGYTDFTNCTFSNQTNFNIIGGKLRNYYYYQTNVTDCATLLPLNATNVTATTNTGAQAFTQLTNPAGNITRQTIQQFYVNTTGDYNYNTPYTITTTLPLYDIETHNETLNTSIIDAYCLNMDATPPTGNITNPTNNSNYTLHDIEISTFSCTDPNLANMTIAFYYPNNTQIKNQTWNASGATTLSQTTSVPLNITQGNTSFYITLNCTDLIPHTYTQTNNYNIYGYQNVSAYDNQDSSIITNWNSTMGPYNYYGQGFEALVSDEFTDNTVDTDKWLVSTYTQGATTTSTVTENTTQQIIYAAMAWGAPPRTAITSSQEKSDYKGYNFTTRVRLYTTISLCTLSVARLELISGDGDNFTVDVENAGAAGAYHNWQFNYTNGNYTILEDGAPSSTVNVTNWTAVYVRYYTTVTDVACGRPGTATVAADFIRAPTDIPSTVKIPTTRTGQGNRTLQVTSATRLGYRYSPANFTITMPLFTANATNITLNRTGFSMNTYNELTGANLTFNATLSNSTVTYYILNQPQQYNYTFNYTAGYADFPTGNVTISVNKTGWATRIYDITINPYTHISLNAYLIKSGSGVWSTFYVVDTEWTPISNADLDFYRQYGSNYVQVAATTTDSFGTVQIYLDPLANYEYRCAATGYALKIGYVTPIASEYYIIMGQTGGDFDFTNASYFFWESLRPPGSLISNDTILAYRINDPDNAIAWFSLNITDGAGHSYWSSNITGSPSGGTITIAVSDIPGLPTNPKTKIHAETHYNRYGVTHCLDKLLWFLARPEDFEPGLGRAMTQMEEELEASSTGALAFISTLVLVITAGALGGMGLGTGFFVLAVGTILAYFNWITWEMFALAAGLAIMTYITLGRRTS